MLRTQRQAEETSAAMRASESRLSREVSRVEALERELANARGCARRSGRQPLPAGSRAGRGTERAPRRDRRPRPIAHIRPSSRRARVTFRFVLRSGGYTVTPFDGEPPEPGQLVEIDGERFTVAKVGPSPLARDPRPARTFCKTRSPPSRPNRPDHAASLRAAPVDTPKVSVKLSARAWGSPVWLGRGDWGW